MEGIQSGREGGWGYSSPELPRGAYRRNGEELTQGSVSDFLCLSKLMLVSDGFAPSPAFCLSPSFS